MSFLENILEAKKEEVHDLHSKYLLSYYRDCEFFYANTISLKKALLHNSRLGIIAEIKRASPSKGILREDFNHMDIAGVYLKNKVDAISILTDNIFFMGDIKFIAEAAQIKTVPILRKDFIIDEYQVFEAKAFGADAILLIAEILTKKQINELTSAAVECGLEVLLEIHSRKQLSKIDFSRNNLIGINNRDLETFKVNTGTSLKLSNLIPDDVIIISESGISSAENINMIKSSKINGVLVGEHFMKADNIEKQLVEFSSWCKYES